MSWGRTVALMLVAGAYLGAVWPITALVTLIFSGFAPGCDTCGTTGPSAGAVYIVLAVLVTGLVIGMAGILRVCLGRPASYRGWILLVGLAGVGSVLPPLLFLLVVDVDRAHHVSGRPSAEIPLAAFVVAGIVWVLGVRWIMARLAVRRWADATG